ncbi:hypothetical protein M422DRAFT_73428 [Sphaerobolus stellatus SS14]|nr:hypothetical protein M422DRAFT_73428 [Sphaerobolus stellatus SS14]
MLIKAFSLFYFTDSGRHSEDRHRSSRYDDREPDVDRYPRRDDRDRRGDRGGDRRDRDGRGGGGGGGRYDDRGRSSRHEDDRRREHPRGGGGRREEEPDRPPRRRDDDRDFGGRGRGRERGRGGGGGGVRPDEYERRSPTPEGCPPLSKRKRKASGWDVHAPGYEQYTAIQAKQTGLFNLPGANRTQVPPILGVAGLPTPMPVATFGMGVGGNPNLARQSRRLYIGSITPEINEINLAEFFNSKMKEMNIGTGGSGDPVLAVQVNYEKNYAFVEFRSAEDATAAMAFDGIMFLSVPLKIRRPKDYAGNDLVTPGVHVPGVVSTNVPDSINKIFVGGLPTYLNEEQVMELLKSFGELKAFNLVRENGNGPSKGFAFFEYADISVTDVAIQGLNGMELGDRYLVVQRASIGAKGGTGMIPNPIIPPEAFPTVPKPIMPAGDLATAPPPEARILLMLNMVTTEDLVNDQDYEDIFYDVREECEKFGPIVDLRIPRPAKRDKSKWGEGGQSSIDAMRADEAAGVGRVYVKYQEAEGAARAMNALAGRSFAGRSIIATLLSDSSQTTPPLNLIFSEQPPPPPPE